jgi:hypothetical protein
VATVANEASEALSGAAYLGTEVRAWRVAAGLSQRQLAERANYGQQYVAKVESGERLASESFCASCDQIFDTHGMFARLRERVNQQGYPAWFVPYVQLERKATQILHFAPTLVPGSLQTADYARAVFRAFHPRERDEAIQANVEARLRRQEVMERENPPLLWAVLHEACLRTVVGTAEAMRAQLAYLIKMAITPHVTIQVLPFGAGAPMMHVPFTLLRFEDDAPVLYAETPQGGRVDDSATVVNDAIMTYDRLRATALSPDDSQALLRKVMEDYAS